MDLTRFQHLVGEHLASRAAELGLDAARLRVEYVLNWGGFVNRSSRCGREHTSRESRGFRG